MEFRKAEMGDSADLLLWRLDPVTIANSLTKAGVSAVDHHAWITRVLSSPDFILLIAEQKGEKLGMVRFNRDKDGSWEVSINLNPAARGRGLGAQILAGAVEAGFTGPTRPVLTAQVRQGNTASWKIFERVGFEVEKIEDGVGLFQLAPSCRVKNRVP